MTTMRALNEVLNESITVSAHIEPRGSIFQNEFLGGVLLIFGIGGVVIKMGFY